MLIRDSVNADMLIYIYIYVVYNEHVDLNRRVVQTDDHLWLVVLEVYVIRSRKYCIYTHVHVLLYMYMYIVHVG